MEGSKTSVFSAKNLDELEVVAGLLLARMGVPRAVGLSGPLGAGKTALVKALCRRLNVLDEVTSPTFSLVQEYVTRAQQRVFHIDLYRIERPEELIEIGLEEILQGKGWIFVEWPEIARFMMPENSYFLEIMVGEGQERTIVIT